MRACAISQSDITNGDLKRVASGIMPKIKLVLFLRRNKISVGVIDITYGKTLARVATLKKKGSTKSPIVYDGLSWMSVAKYLVSNYFIINLYNESKIQNLNRYYFIDLSYY